MRSRGSGRVVASAAGVILLALSVVLLRGLREEREAERVPVVGAAADRVLLVSLDGLAPAALRTLGPTGTPVLHGLMARGAWTWNARADAQSTETLPNHASMITGRAVAEHGYRDNSVEGLAPEALVGHALFEGVARSGREVALVASKEKLRLFADRWRGAVAAVSVAERDDAATVEALDAIVRARAPALVFLHLAAADRAGHAHGWESAAYLDAVRRVDALLGEAVAIVSRGDARTAIVVTSDHGGHGDHHDVVADPLNFTVPLVVVVPGAPGGRDLYAINAAVRADPGSARTSSSSGLPPIRSAEVANLVAGLLGVEAVPGSTANAARDLAW